jgi:hypothetical protein
LLWIDAGLRTPYVQSWFAGVQQQLSDNLYVEINHLGTLGRKLIASDEVNRPPAGSISGMGGINPGLPSDIEYRSNFGSSDYLALTGLVRYRAARRAWFQVAYTYGHSIDNQSDALQGQFEDLGFVGNAGSGSPNLAALTRQFDSRADRGSSDFDQRHNLVFYSIWDLPGSSLGGWRRRLFGGWEAAQIAGFRSGFPYNLISSGAPACAAVPANAVEAQLANNRPNLIPSSPPLILSPSAQIPGGVQLLNPSAVCDPPPGVLGTVGRNSLIGPGFWNVDASIAKSFALPWLGEAGRLQFRADFFNAFNHANLGSPNGTADSTFGYAYFGRQGFSNGFPSVKPLDELPRQIQLQLKIFF